MTTLRADAPIVVAVTELERVRRLGVRSRVVVDGLTRDLPLPVLARVVALRRLVRAGGGELVLAAGTETTQTLRRAGLWMLLITEPTIAAATAALERATAAQDGDNDAA